MNPRNMNMLGALAGVMTTFTDYNIGDTRRERRSRGSSVNGSAARISPRALRKRNTKNHMAADSRRRNR